jgi:hypothetical protein
LVNNYEEIICTAVDIIAEQKIKNAKFNSTVRAVVLECTNPNLAEYKVKYQDSTFLAYGLNKYLQYKENTLVYIFIPNNDFSEKKIILGSTTSGESTLPILNAKIDEENYLVLSVQDTWSE